MMVPIKDTIFPQGLKLYINLRMDLTKDRISYVKINNVLPSMELITRLDVAVANWLCIVN